MTALPLPKKRRVEAYAQGELDGLCAIYSIINAFRALSPEIDEVASERLFRFLVRSLEARAKQFGPSLVFGISGSMLAKLLADAQHYARSQLKIEMRAERKGAVLRSTSISVVWEWLLRAFDDQTVMILPLEGCCNHWTVLYDVKPDRLRLIDSDYRRKLKRSRCTLGRSKTLYQLKLSGVIAITRVERSA